MKYTYRLLCISLLLLTNSVFAMVQTDEASLPLHEVTFTLSAEHWVTTQSAKVIVSLNAVLQQDELADLNQSIQKKLQTLSLKQVWHITQMQRSINSAGLEQVSVSAQARLPLSQLAHLREQANKVSQEGSKLTIQDIIIQPSLQEIEQAKAKLRETLYQQVQAEIKRLNSIFLERKYQVKRIDFSRPSGIMTMVMKSTQNSANPVSTLANNTSVSQQIKLQINVTLMSKK